MLRFRPVQARWFETYLPHEQTVRGLELIARSGVVELETDPRLSEPMDTHRLHYFVQRSVSSGGSAVSRYARNAGEVMPRKSSPSRTMK
jgi:hypothetical protein